MSGEDKESWERIGQHVIKTLERMEEKIESLDEKMNQANLDTHVEITALKVRAGLWGTIAGIIAGALVSVVVGYIIYNMSTPKINLPDVHFYPKQPAPTKPADNNGDGQSMICPLDNRRLFFVDGRAFIA